MIEITLEDLVHVYPNQVRAVDGVSLRIGPGEAVGLIGQNGSGKTTLVRHLNGLLRPTSGRVVVGGADAAGLRVAVLAARVGLVFQDPDRQIFSGSVREEVAFGPRNLGVRGDALATAVARGIDAVGLRGEEATNPQDLGASRRRLLGLAAVLSMGTPVLVLDEPTTGQDRRGVERVRVAVDGARAAGRTVITISHDLRFVAEVCDRVVVMRAGRVLLDDTPGRAFAAANVATLRSTGLEPPAAAVIGARLGLRDVATEVGLIATLAAAGRGGASAER